MKQRVMIVGAGQLGQSLQLCLPDSEWELLPLYNLPDFDLTDANQVMQTVSSVQPSVIINTAAYTAVDQAEIESEQAYAVNALGVGYLGEAAREVCARLIHVSTDYVFKGDQTGRYKEADPTNPMNQYGVSKLAGEQLLVEIEALEYVIVRTAWLYSNIGRNFLNTMLKALHERSELKVVDDQIGTPTSAVSLAKVIWKIVNRPDLQGLYHWTDAGVASWYDFAFAIQEQALEYGLLEEAVPIVPVSTQQYPTPAKRPPCSLLDTQKLVRACELEPLNWRQALVEVLQERI